MKYSANFRQQDFYSWQDDLLTISTEITNTIDDNRVEEICKHFQCDLSEFREYLRIKRSQFKTNGDRIRAMSDEDLAAFLNHHGNIGCSIMGEWHSGMCAQPCHECWLKWLQEVNE